MDTVIEENLTCFRMVWRTTDPRSPGVARPFELRTSVSEPTLAEMPCHMRRVGNIYSSLSTHLWRPVTIDSEVSQQTNIYDLGYTDYGNVDYSLKGPTPQVYLGKLCDFRNSVIGASPSPHRRVL
jgi:hypothetical protein